MKKMILALAAVIVFVLLLGCDGISDQTPEVTESTASTVHGSIPEPSAPDEPDEPNVISPDETTAGVNEEPVEPEKPAPLDKSKTYDVLFIGNSCTSKNDLNLLFEKIAESAGYKVNTTRVVKGGWYLDGHADPTDEAGAKVAEQLASKKWDFVVFQDQVRGFFQAKDRIQNGITAITEKVRGNGAVPVLYVTWSYADGHSYMDQKNLTYDSMSWGIISQCQAIAKGLDIKVAYAGYAMREFYLNLGDSANVYDPDKVHSSVLGSYISALTIFSTIFNVAPSDVPHYNIYFMHYASLGIDYITAAVYEDFEIPDKYKIK